MNVPKGWKIMPIKPTEGIVSVLTEMLTHCRTVEESYDDLLAAAPTPPVQTQALTGLLRSDQIEFEAWINKVGYTIRDHSCAWIGWQAATRRLEGRIAELNKTPPAQEVEPVGYIDERGNFWSLARYERAVENRRLHNFAPVFTRPQSYELVERVSVLFEALKNDTCGECVEMKEFIALRKTLEKYAPPKDRSYEP